MIGYWVSFVTGIVLLGVGSYTAYLFKDIYHRANHEASSYLSTGILLLIFSVVSNTLYWQVFGQTILYFEYLSVVQLREMGFWLDLLFKGSGIIGCLYAIKGMKILK